MKALVKKNAGKGLGHRTMSAAAAQELRRRILSGSFPAGSALRQDALADEFGFSRIPIREALMQLEAEGLVTIVPHKGAIVSTMSLAEVEELFELRAMIEPMLLKRSAPHLTAKDYANLRAILASYSATLTARDRSRWGEMNSNFHMALYQHADRPKSLALAEKLLQDCDRHTRIQLSLDGAIGRAESEHAELVKLCEAGRYADAATLLKQHIEHVGRSLRSETKA